MLRHYDRLGLLTPDHIDQVTHYRYYSADQLARLNRILFFKDLGFSLEQIKGLLKRKLTSDHLRGLLLSKQEELRRQVEESHARLARVEARLQQIEQEGQPSPYEVTTKSAETMVVASVRQVVPSLQEMGHYCQLFELSVGA